MLGQFLPLLRREGRLVHVERLAARAVVVAVPQVDAVGPEVGAVLVHLLHADLV